jgi:hypothetical protein
MPGSTRDAAAGPTSAPIRQTPADEALAMMVEALRLIDLEGGADVAGAHLDLAIHRLREWIGQASG